MALGQSLLSTKRKWHWHSNMRWKTGRLICHARFRKQRLLWIRRRSEASGEGELCKILVLRRSKFGRGLYLEPAIKRTSSDGLNKQRRITRSPPGRGTRAARGRRLGSTRASRGCGMSRCRVDRGVPRKIAEAG